MGGDFEQGMGGQHFHAKVAHMLGLYPENLTIIVGTFLTKKLPLNEPIFLKSLPLMGAFLLKSIPVLGP